ncbi:Protein ROOT PRIMORDIUM DEFECTIVE 1 [Linum perenne]
MIHELLSLTVEKRVEVQRIAHFKKDFGMEMEVNLRELLLKHPGIFYISTKGSTQLVFLREAYAKGCLVESNPIYVVRKKMLDLILVGRRNTKELQCSREEDIERMNNLVS